MILLKNGKIWWSFLKILIKKIKVINSRIMIVCSSHLMHFLVNHKIVFHKINKWLIILNRYISLCQNNNRDNYPVCVLTLQGFQGHLIEYLIYLSHQILEHLIYLPHQISLDNSLGIIQIKTIMSLQNKKMIGLHQKVQIIQSLFDLLYKFEFG